MILVVSVIGAFVGLWTLVDDCLGIRRHLWACAGHHWAFWRAFRRVDMCGHGVAGGQLGIWQSSGSWLAAARLPAGRDGDVARAGGRAGHSRQPIPRMIFCS